MSGGDAEKLEPRVEVACTVCGSRSTELVCSEAEVRAQLAYLDRFHRRRLRPARRKSTDEALADRADFTQDYATDIVSCTSCRLVFRESRPRASEITAAYAQDRYGQERLHALHDSQLELFRAKAQRLHRLLSARPNPRIVEVGSFVGGFLGAARERGWDALGIDPGEEVAEFCREKGLAVLRTTAAEAPIEESSVDCVAVWNTFDQIPDPRPTLGAIRRWLRADGIVALRVPNGACFRTAIAALRRVRPPLSDALLAALAWNNLLAFPYLQGHSVATLDRLIAPFELARVAADPDTLTRLADDHTKTWAAWEERLLKLAWRGLARAGVAQPPWIDAYYRRTARPA
jgi:SAM-dependent methyltransferase